MGKKKWRKAFNNRPFYEKLAIPTAIFERIRALTLEADGEISGFGRTKIVDGETYFSGSAITVDEFDIFTQVCNAAHTTLKKDDMTQMYVGVARAGGDPSQWNFWWHSHVNFDTGFSSEDDNTMKNITRPKNGQKGSMLVALCTNKHGDHDATVYYSGRRLMERLPLIIIPALSEEIIAKAQEDIKTKVTYETYNRPSYVREFMLVNHDEEDFESDISLDGKIQKPGYPPLRKVVEVDTSKLSKNQRRKFDRYNKEPKLPFQRQKGWAVKSS